MVFHGEVNFGGLPFVAEFIEQGGDQAQEGGFIGEEAGDAGAALEFLVDPFQSVVGAQSELVGEWQGEDGETLGQIGFHPGGAVGSAGGIVGHDFFLASVSGRVAGRRRRNLGADWFPSRRRVWERWWHSGSRLL